MKKRRTQPSQLAHVRASIASLTSQLKVLEIFRWAFLNHHTSLVNATPCSLRFPFRPPTLHHFRPPISLLQHERSSIQPLALEPHETLLTNRLTLPRFDDFGSRLTSVTFRTLSAVIPRCFVFLACTDASRIKLYEYSVSENGL